MKYAQRRYAHRVAVTIGINTYAQAAWQPLHAAAADAQHIAELFRAMGFDRVERLENEAATRNAILDLLERRLPDMVGEQDLVVVFFAGHGATAGDQGYVIPADASSDLERTAISLQRLKDSALRMPARHTLFLADACFSGRMLRRARSHEPDPVAYWEAAASDRVVQIVTAGGADELAQESDGWGWFTRAIHTGLTGKADQNLDGVVTTEELVTYAASQVHSEGTAPQHPQWGTVEGSGTVVLLDLRQVPRGERPAPSRSWMRITGLERPLDEIHDLMQRRRWGAAENRLRATMLAQRHDGYYVRYVESELRLLLAEVYVEQDTLGNEKLIETELRSVRGVLTQEQQQRLSDLRARLEEARRGPL
jgi:hypothetical protein